jgi:hypothetical protein
MAPHREGAPRTPVPTDRPHFAAQAQGSWEAALQEIEHLAQHWDTPDHSETGHLIAQALCAAARLAVGDPAVITAQFDHFDGDHRRRLLDAADVLLAALEDARHSGQLHHIRGDLGQLRDDLKRVRRVVQRQPGISDSWS